MAKILMMTGPYTGHVTPCVPIVQKLVERGNEVVWITGREFKGRVETTGATFRPLPQESDPNGREVYEFYPELGQLEGLPQIKHWVKHIFVDGSRREISAIDAALADFGADVLLGDSVTFGVYFAAELRCLPSACISLLPGSIPSRDTAPYGLGRLPGTHFIARMKNRILNAMTHHVLLRDLTTYTNRMRRSLGLKPLEGPLFAAMPRTISLVLHTSTDAFEYPRSDLPENIHYIGPVLPERHADFQGPAWWSELRDPCPVVLVNQGTIATVLDNLIVPAIQGLRDQQMQVIAVPVGDSQLGELPSNVHADVFVPFDRLLPHVDVMVTNGGYGGTQLALAHGIPLVVAGETEDKREVAARVEWSGAGINLRKQRPSPQEIREAVREVLENPIYRRNARRIQADFAKYDAPTRAAELLETLACGEESAIATSRRSPMV